MHEFEKTLQFFAGQKIFEHRLFVGLSTKIPAPEHYNKALCSPQA